MNEELRQYIEKYIKYFELDSLLDKKEMSKEEVQEVLDNLDELDEECRKFTPRVIELMENI